MNSLRTIVILGASANPARHSNMLMNRLLERENYQAIPVNPGPDEISGRTVYASLDAAAASLGARPDILTMYVSPSRSSALEAEILRLKPHKVIFNPGAENPSLEAALNRGGVVTENACSLILLSQNVL